MQKQPTTDHVQEAVEQIRQLDYDEAPVAVASAHVRVLVESFGCRFVGCVLDYPGQPAHSATICDGRWDTGVDLRRIIEKRAFDPELELGKLTPTIVPLQADRYHWGHWVVSKEAKKKESSFDWIVRYLAATAVNVLQQRHHEKIMAELQPLCVLADLISPISHELQNVLNSMLLQAAILERSAPADLKEDLSRMRTLGIQAGEVMKQFNHYRYGHGVQRYQVDLNRIVAEVADAHLADGNAVRVKLELQTSPCPVQAAASDVTRLVELVLKQAIQATAAQTDHGVVQCSTREEDGKTLLKIVDQGGKVSPDRLPELFQVATQVREGTDSMELLACQAMVRRLGGVMWAEPTPSGLAFMMEFENLNEGI